MGFRLCPESGSQSYSEFGSEYEYSFGSVSKFVDLNLNLDLNIVFDPSIDLYVDLNLNSDLNLNTNLNSSNKLIWI